MLKGVLLAWLLCGKRGVFGDVVGLLGSVGLGAIGEEEGGRNNKYKANNATQYKT